ncbi:hypothetical protein SAMN05421544_11462 [Riemerella columbipharyngis]|uniref:Uncharacterized protein n=1 Tax=Riemerella columbipharyngis TaxID=1071918 RepID=A0A1G7E8A7_9FLAO|nr:hypothetical protein SAMN05421544_11462 [Riemerella columbipharyngis]
MKLPDGSSFQEKIKEQEKKLKGYLSSNDNPIEITQ